MDILLPLEQMEPDPLTLPYIGDPLTRTGGARRPRSSPDNTDERGRGRGAIRARTGFSSPEGERIYDPLNEVLVTPGDMAGQRAISAPKRICRDQS